MELMAVKILIGGVTGLLPYGLGNVDLPLAACLLGGSIRAALAGSFRGIGVPAPWLPPSRCTIRLATDTRMLLAPGIP